MGAIVSCMRDLFRSIGACLMAIVHGVANICKAIINGVVAVIDVLISCLTCGYCGRRKRMARRGTTHYRSRRVI